MVELARTSTRALLLLLLLALVAGCGRLTRGFRAPSGAGQAVGALAPDPGGVTGEAVAGPLLQAAERCSTILPRRVAEPQRAFVASVSAEQLPWSLALPVERYERIEQVDGQGKRTVRERLRFAAGMRAAIVNALSAALPNSLVWEERAPQSDGCAGELTCVPLHARFAAPRTVLLVRGSTDTRFEPEPACDVLLARYPAAFEVSARSLALTFAELRETHVLLSLVADGVARLTLKHYADAPAARRARAAALRGGDELPLFGGNVTRSLGLRRGARVEQRAFVSFDELALRVGDRARLARAEPSLRAENLADIAPEDTEAVKAAVDARLLAPGPSKPTSHHAEGLALDALLEKARAHAPTELGLLRRHYDLQLDVLNESAAALATAEQALALSDGAAAWSLRLRAALAALAAEPRLTSELARVHRLPHATAQRMARELVARARYDVAGSAHAYHERAEWAFMTARALARAAPRSAERPLSGRLPLAELPRLLAYLAAAHEPASELSLQLLVLSEDAAVAAPRDTAHAEAPWRLPTGGAGEPGVLLATGKWDDSHFSALGELLLGANEEGPLALLVGLERPGSEGRAVLALRGRREGGDLVLERASRPLAQLHWPTLERLLAAPLRGLTGAAYPPDALTIEAQDASEALAVKAAAESEPGVRCTLEMQVVQCRGALSDEGAATRALLAVARSLLAREGRALWSVSESRRPRGQAL